MRKTASRILATLATAALVLTMSLAPASAAVPVAGDFTITGKIAAKITPPTQLKSGAWAPDREIKLTVTLTGTPNDKGYSDTNGDGAVVRYYPWGTKSSPRVAALKTKEKDPYVPSISSPSSLKTGKNTFRVHVSQYASPGLYEARIPVMQTYSPANSYTEKITTKVVKVRFQVRANTKTSRSETLAYAAPWGKGKTATVELSAPEYQQGAKVNMYYKKNGAKKYTKIATNKLSMNKRYSGFYSTAIFKTKKLTKSGKVYFKVGTVKYAKGFKTNVTKVRVS